MNIDNQYIFKILLVGDSGIGKSSLMLRYHDDIFTESFLPTIGVDFRIKTIHIDNSTIAL